MKYFILLWVPFLCFVSVVGQEHSLFLIAGQGCPSNCNDEYSQHFPVHLLKVSNDTIQKISDLASGNEFVYKIIDYKHLKKSVIYKSSLLNNKKAISIVDYSQRLKIDTLERIFPPEAFLDYMLYLVDLKEPYIIIKYYPNFNEKRDSIYYYGVNLNTLKDTIFTANILVNIQTYGGQGIAQVEGTSDFSDIIKFKTYENNQRIAHKLIYPRVRPIDTCSIFIPDLVGLSAQYPLILKPTSEKGFRIFQVYNKDFVALSTNFSWDEKKLIGQHQYSIFSNELQLWLNTPFLSGSYENGIKIIENYLIGYIANEYQWGFQQKIKKYEQIPGLQYRQNFSIYGSTFDERVKNYQLFPEGVLYVFNLKTLKYIEWPALENGRPQGDSEILFVENEVVFYRINDKIFKVPIINGEILGKSVLLVQDFRIPDVHWAFLSEN